MPIYEYRCEACGHMLDALQKISDAPLTDCSECGESALKKLMSAPSFRLKGGGWYETDFKSDKEKKRNLVEAKSADSKDAVSKGDSTKDAGKSDSKKESGSGGESKAKSVSDKKPPKKSGSEAA